MKVAGIIRHRVSEFILGRAGDNFLTLADKLARGGFGAVIILEDEGTLLGIVTERDLVRAASRDGVAALTSRADDIMTCTVHVCHPEDSDADVASYMIEMGVRHIPIVRSEKVVGAVSFADGASSRVQGASYFARVAIAGEVVTEKFSRHLTRRRPEVG